MFEVAENSLDACNAINLACLKHFVGMSRYLEKLGSRETYGPQVLDMGMRRFVNDSASREARPGTGKLHWTEEFSWIPVAA